MARSNRLVEIVANETELLSDDAVSNLKEQSERFR